jgi:hypothetical protein
MGGGSGAMAAGTAQTFPDLKLVVTDIDPAMVQAARQRPSRSESRSLGVAVTGGDPQGCQGQHKQRSEDDDGSPQGGGPK